jgi:hypothetical protein
MNHRETDPWELGFRKSSYSAGNGACVEVGIHSRDQEVFVRDTKDHGEGPSIRYSAGSWSLFIGQVKLSKPE